MELITGHAGRPHVTSGQHRSIFEKIIGKDSYILDGDELLSPELQSNQSIRIRSGMLCHHGSISEVKKNTYDEVIIANGSQGMKRIDLIVARYEKNPVTEIESMKWVVIRGNPSATNPTTPSYTRGNMQNGDLKDDCPVFKVHLNGIQVTRVEKLLTVLGGSLSTMVDKGFTNISDDGAVHRYRIGNEIHVIGSLVTQSAGDYIQLFTLDKLQELFGAPFDMTRFSVSTFNGDATSARVHLYAPEFWGATLYQYYYPAHNGPIRVNYHLVYKSAS